MRAATTPRPAHASERPSRAVPMHPRRRRGALALALVPVAAALVGWAGPTLHPSDAGAPWVSLEIPANPLDEAHRSAVAIVRTYYHERPVDFALEGTAEGVVDGERRSVPLRFERTGQRGAVAVRQTWPNAGEWTLVIGAEGASTTLVAELGPDGGVGEGEYYGRPVSALVARSIDVRARGQSETAAQVRARLDAVAARGR